MPNPASLPHQGPDRPVHGQRRITCYKVLSLEQAIYVDVFLVATTHFGGSRFLFQSPRACMVQASQISPSEWERSLHRSSFDFSAAISGRHEALTSSFRGSQRVYSSSIHRTNQCDAIMTNRQSLPTAIKSSWTVNHRSHRYPLGVQLFLCYS